MARPRKQTVDWFPHSVTHGRTIFVMERRWGIAGYGFWFKLLEILGNTERHFIDAENKASMDYLQAYTYTDQDTCLEMLEQLADLEAIDPKLWKGKVIWTDNFVAGLAAVYRNRNLPLPDRPDNYRKKSGLAGVSDAGNPIRKEGRKEGKRKDIASPDNGDASPFFSCRFFVVDRDYRDKLAKEYPAMIDPLLLKEFSRMEDFLTDNPRPKRANGQLKNPKLFIRNWLDRTIIKEAPTPAREPPSCSKCSGSGFRKAKPGEESINGMVRCECKEDKTDGRKTDKPDGTSH
jgi:hypothetical protein